MIMIIINKILTIIIVKNNKIKLTIIGKIKQIKYKNSYRLPRLYF